MDRTRVAASLTAVLISAYAPSLCSGGVKAVCVNTEPVTAAPAVPGGARARMKYARELYDHGIYAKAREIFSTFPGDPVAEGFSVLCDIRMKTPGYEVRLEEYADKYAYSGLVPQMRCLHALNLFDAADYPSASSEFAEVDEKALYRTQVAEFRFKKAYSDFEIGLDESALRGFMDVYGMPRNEYQAPAAYSAAYILYEREQFTDAEMWFGRAGKDSRFAEVSSYYIMECRFMNKDYKYVTDNAARMFASVPEERRPHLARIISESYLVQGDAASAKQYYDRTDAAKSRKDYFYAGSLLYALKDYKGAVENYTLMSDRTDSLGQIANYQLGYSYIQIKNKVAAYGAFKDASEAGYDKNIQEDAFFNYAKLAFDLNNDPSVFDSYIRKYPEQAKGDRIYSYMALAALYNRDYAAAVEAYDKIDELDEDMKNNYMKANYLRADQLVSSGSYRKAVPCLKAAAYYSDKRTPFNQLSRYWLAESMYRDENYAEASQTYKSLYNTSALNGRPEGASLPYDIAYCYFKSGEYAEAEKWFDIYLESGDKADRRDALTRKGDSRFIRKEYKDAIASYEAAISEYPQLDDLYPYYQAGLAYALTDNQKAETKLLSSTRRAKPDASFWCETEYELGRAFMSVGNNGDAADVFKSIVRDGRDSTYQARALIGLGMISANESKYDDALGYYKKVVEGMPSSEYSEDALRAIESIYQTLQEPEKYFSYLKSVGGQKSGADGESMFFNAAEQIFLAENWQKALTTLQAYLDEYPHGENAVLAEFYMAESCRNVGKKEQACDWYRKVIESGDGSFVEASALNFARLSYGLQRYQDAYSGYQELLSCAKIENNRHTALVGMMNSAYYGKDYSSAVAAAENVAADSRSDADDKRRAEYVEAKSFLAVSQRDKAFSILKKLSAFPSTPEGAEARYLIIQDCYDRAGFEDVEKLVYDFSDSGTSQTYWLAKSFIVLGDSFAERGDMAQAKATFESIRDGYVPEGKDDEILDNVNVRLKKISERGE